MNGLEFILLESINEQIKIKNYVHVNHIVELGIKDIKKYIPESLKKEEGLNTFEFDEMDQRKVRQLKKSMLLKMFGKNDIDSLMWIRKVKELIKQHYPKFKSVLVNESRIYYDDENVEIHKIKSLKEFLDIISKVKKRESTLINYEGLEKYIWDEYEPQDFFKCVKNTSLILKEANKDLEKFKSKTMDELFENDKSLFGDTVHLYRGQTDMKYTSYPVLFRNENLLNNERDLFNEIINSNREDFNDCKSSFEILSKMQHYGLPTRMLDLTSNPLVALYFAASSDNKLTGEVMVYTVLEAEILYPDDEEVDIVSNISRLREREKRRISNRIQQHCVECGSRFRYCEEFNNEFLSEKMRTQLGMSSRELILPLNLMGYQFVKPSNLHKRIERQSSVFAFYSFTNGRQTEFWDQSKIDLIFVENKPSIRKELERVGIDAFTLFPELENRAKHFSSKYSKIR